MSTMVEERAPKFVGDLRKITCAVYAGPNETFFIDAIKYRGEQGWIWITHNHLGKYGGEAKYIVVENEMYKVIDSKPFCWYKIEKVD